MLYNMFRLKQKRAYNTIKFNVIEISTLFYKLTLELYGSRNMLHIIIF